MSFTRCILLSRCALAGCALSLGACLPPAEVDLGAYHGHDRERDAALAHDGAVEAATPPDDAGPPGDPLGAAPACASTGCVSSEGPPNPRPAVHCHPLVITAGMSPPLPPGGPADHFANFTLPAPVQGQEYLVSISPIIDNPQTLHHMKLYESKRVPTAPGQPPPPRRLLYSWAPGVAGFFLDPSLGIPVPPDTDYILEIHYTNATEVWFDGSGFDACFTPTPPEHLVSISSLSAEGPPAGPATGTCAPEHTRPITLLSAQSDLRNSLGRHLKLLINREGDEEETLLDEPYSHEYGGYRLLSAQLQPGDTLDTRCDYAPPALEIPGVKCEIQVLHWPAHTLVSGAAQENALEGCRE